MNIELLSFLTVSFLMAVTPGPSVVYVVSYSLRYGTKAGVISTLGINFGSIIAIMIVAFGLSSVLARFPNALLFIQMAGGLYVIYLAKRMWPRGQSSSTMTQDPTAQSYRTLFRNGFVTSILNPKDILFYTAFIPAFIPQGITHGAYQNYFLGLAFSFMFIGFITKTTFAVFSGHAKSMLDSGNASFANFLSSFVLFCLGIYILLKSLSNFYH